MNIQFLSDLHLEMHKDHYYLSDTSADVIILAGDIHIGSKGIDWAVEEAQRLNTPIIYIAGNHEYYKGNYPSVLQDLRDESAKHDLVHFLENDEIIINDVRFLGCTFWTDYECNSGDRPFNMAYVQQSINDHRLIWNGNKQFTPSDALAVHKQSKAWLQAKLDEDFNGKTVVVTHHGPSNKCQHINFEQGAISTAFQSDLDDMVKQADLWIYGHTHSNVDTTIGNCKLVSNQLGYPGETTPPDGFKADWVVVL